MRTGEVSFPVLMTRYFATPLACSLAALLWFRLMDLHALAAVALFPVGGRWVDRWRVGLLVVVWLSLPWWSFQIQPSSAPARLGQRLPPRRRARLAGARDGLPKTPAAFWRAWFWTLLSWLVKLALFAWVLQLFAPLPAAAFLHLFVLGLSLVGGALALLLHPDIAAPAVSNDHG